MKHGVKMCLTTFFRDTFLLVGGEGNGYFSTILEYDTKIEGWITWEDRLGEGRRLVNAMMVDSALFPECV
jgi:hypothetical protein